MMKQCFALWLTLLTVFAPLTHANDLFDSKPFSIFETNEPELMPVEQAFVLDVKQDDNQLQLNFEIADGYYLYRDKLKITVTNAELGDIELPVGKMHFDDYFGEQAVYYEQVQIPAALKSALVDAEISVNFMGCAEGKLCFPPTTYKSPVSEVASNEGFLIASKQATTQQASATASSSESTSAETFVSEQQGFSQMLNQDNLILTLLIFFGLGIGLALTPCVFPMYPILSGIIVGQKQQLSTRKAFTLSMVYVQGMAITYALLGLVVASAGMQYQAALQHPAILVFLALMFAILSLSMFGLYDINLPASWQEKLNNASNKQQGGNVTGVFIMGVISGLVASPCTTAPLSGVLIYVAQSGDLFLGFITLYVLAMGMGVPLLLMGTSGGKLLPRAGQWMEVVKTIFGFLLLAVSIVMLGRIWPGLLSDLLWTVWGIALAGYLLHQNKLSQFNWQQSARQVLLLLLLMASFSYGLQAVMGHFGYGMSAQQNATQASQFIKIKSVDDLNALVKQASAQGKPVMVDLYADWCVACKEFENITFKAPEVQQRFAEMVLLKADVTAMDATDNALLDAYNVLGLPTLLMFDRQGQAIEGLTVTGFMEPRAFAAQLDKLLQQ